MNQTMPVFSKTPWSKKTSCDTESVAGLTIRNGTGMPTTPYLEQIRTALPFAKQHNIEKGADKSRFSNRKSSNQDTSVGNHLMTTPPPMLKVDSRFDNSKEKIQFTSGDLKM